MGDIADAMIEGDLCCECGSVLECDGFGIPIMCHDCHSEYQKRCNVPHEGEAGIFCERFYGRSKDNGE